MTRLQCLLSQCSFKCVQRRINIAGVPVNFGSRNISGCRVGLLAKLEILFEQTQRHIRVSLSEVDGLYSQRLTFVASPA
ncbi:MAG: hypothetical protein JWN21_399 [Sphingomonas bacterium]|nr:hypothetical protein [Sphingomonas bacterium]